MKTAKAIITFMLLASLQTQWLNAMGPMPAVVPLMLTEPGLTFGPEGQGNTEPMPPGKTPIQDFINLAGDAQNDIDAIAAGLQQYGYINPYQTDGSINPDYKDANGNIRLISDRWIKYNTDNKPIKIITADGTITEMEYDYSGHRVRKTVTGEMGDGETRSTIYIGDLTEITDGVTTNHIFAGSQRIAFITNGQTRYYHKDHLGSTTHVTDESGAVVQDVKYTPFGNVWSQTGNVTNHLYTDHENDPSTKLTEMKARMADLIFCRFLTPDNLIPEPYNPQSLNRYSYVENNPIMYNDPTGHKKGWSHRNWWETNYDHAEAWIENTAQKNNVTIGQIGVGAGYGFGGPAAFEKDSGMRIPNFQPKQTEEKATSALLVDQSKINQMDSIMDTGIEAVNSAVEKAFFEPFDFLKESTYNVIKAKNAASTRIGGWLPFTADGEKSAMWYADRFNESGLGGKFVYGAGGIISSAWTADTAVDTALTFGSGWSSAGWASRTGRWVGTVGPHPPHHGMGRHFEAILRIRNTQYKLIIPGRKRLFFWDKKIFK